MDSVRADIGRRVATILGEITVFVGTVLLFLHILLLPRTSVA